MNPLFNLFNPTFTIFNIYFVTFLFSFFPDEICCTFAMESIYLQGKLILLLKIYAAEPLVITWKSSYSWDFICQPGTTKNYSTKLLGNNSDSIVYIENHQVLHSL